MSQTSKTYLRGIMVPDDRLEFWPEESGEYDNAGTSRLAALPQAGPAPGVPEPQQATSMILRTSGDQGRDKSLYVETRKAGLPDRSGAAFVWKYEDDASWRGWDVPNIMTGWEEISWTTSSASSNLRPHALTTESGKILVAAQRGTTTPSVYVHQRTTAGVWSSTLVALEATSTQDNSPCLVQLPSGRILLFHWVEDATQQTCDIRMMYTDDEMTTAFQTGQRFCLPEGISVAAGANGYDVGRIRAAFSNGQILLVVQLRDGDTTKDVRDVFRQYVSVDEGCTFYEVGEWSGTGSAGGIGHDILVADGKFHFFHIDFDTDLPRLRTIASAYEDLANVTSTAVAGTEVWAVKNGAGNFWDDYDLTAWRDEAGCLYVTGRQPTVSNQWIVVRSGDGGVTWSAMGEGTGGSGTGKWCDLNDGSTYPADACATFQQGRAFIVHSFECTPATADESLVATILGGYTTLTMPGLSTRRQDIRQVTFDYTWLPYDEPGDVAWTRVVTGAPTDTITSGRLVTTTAPLEAISYERNPSGTIAEGCIVEVALYPVSGTAYLEVRLADGVDGYVCTVGVTTTSVTAADTVSATQIGTASHGNPAGGVHVRVSMQDNHCTVWYRAYDSGPDRQWTLLGQRSAMTSAGATYANNIVKWGHAVTGADEAQWRFVQYVFDSFAGETLASGGTELFPRPYSSDGTYIDDGVVLHALDGPTVYGDQWLIATRYSHPATDLLPQNEPAPGRGWRSSPISEFDASTRWVHVAFKIDQNASDSFLGNHLVALFLEALNAANVSVDLRYGGAWNNVTSTGVHIFSGDRRGNVVLPTNTSTFGNKVRFNEYAGCGIGFYSAAYTVADWIGKVRGNTEGITNTNGVTTKKAAIYLEDEDSGSSVSPSVAVWPRRTLIVIHPSGFSPSVEGIRLRFPVATGTGAYGNPVDDYFELGKFLFGPVQVFGHDYSRERNLSVEANIEVTTAVDGSRRSRVLGPPRRAVGFAFTDGIDVSNYRSQTGPDYVRGSANAGSDAVAFTRDIPLKLMDIVRAINGAHTPILYLPLIDYDSNSGSSGNVDQTNTNWGEGAIYGRIVSPVRVSQVLGNEEVDEVYNIAEVVIEEEVGDG